MSRSSVPASLRWDRPMLPALPPHVDAPLILEHPSVRPLILEITDDEFRTGHLHVPEPPAVPVIEQPIPQPKPRRRSLAVIAAVTSVTALLLVAIVPARFADRARASQEPAAATVEPSALPVLIVQPATKPIPASASVTPSTIPSAITSAPVPMPVRVPVPVRTSAPAKTPAPTTEAPFGVGDPGF